MYLSVIIAAFFPQWLFRIASSTCRSCLPAKWLRWLARANGYNVFFQCSPGRELLENVWLFWLTHLTCILIFYLLNNRKLWQWYMFQQIFYNICHGIHLISNTYINYSPIFQCFSIAFSPFSDSKLLFLNKWYMGTVSPHSCYFSSHSFNYFKQSVFCQYWNTIDDIRMCYWELDPLKLALQNKYYIIFNVSVNKSK